MEEPLASGLPPKRFAVQVGLALSLFLGFCDLVVSTNTQLIEIHSAVALLGPLVGMFAAVLAAYSAGLLFIAVPLGRLTSLKTQGLTLAVGVSAAAPFLFSIVWSQALTEGTAFPRPHILGLGLTCWVFVATYLAWEGLAKFRGAPSFVLRIGFSMPFVLAETFAFQWLIREAVGLQRSWGFFLLLALYLVVCAVTIRYMTRPRRELRVFGGLLSLSAALCLSLAVSFTVENYSKGSLPPVSERAHRIRRVILLTVDTLRRDALSCCGGTTPTPHIDRLAKDAILFERAHSASPWTLPSLTTILSGLSPWVHGVRRIDHQVPVGLPSLALFFRKDDYVTAGIGSNYFLHTRGSYASLSVGFDSYDTYPVYHRPLTLGRDILLRLMGIYLTQVTTRCRIGEMEDYPRNLAEFEARFATEQACREYLCQLRWPEGFRCPRCGHDKAWAVRTALLECAGCGHQASPTAGTIFQDTRQPLQSWFRAMWWLTSQKNGASALGLQRVLGLGSYKTAWTWLHKLRRAMVRPGRDRLSGRVEVDETYLGGLEEGVRGRQTDAKALIVVAAEEDGAGIGRVRIRTIPNASGDSLMAFVGESIEPGSVVHTDGWLGYEPLEGDGYRHEVSYLEGQPARASKLLPRVHRVVSLVKRWILGTHQGAVSHEHLDSYLDEFAFRFNRRKSRSRGKLFYRLVQQAVAVPPAPYKSLVGGTATRATDDHNM